MRLANRMTVADKKDLNAPVATARVSPRKLRHPGKNGRILLNLHRSIPQRWRRRKGQMELALSLISLALAVYDRIEREIEKRRKRRNRD
jgi:hypothetical protein